MGGIFIIKFLIENKIKVKKIITVAGFNNLKFNDDFNLYKSFYIEDSGLEEIKNYCSNIICLYSDDDPYVPYEYGKMFAEVIANVQHMIPGGGHFNSKAGYTEFKELIKFIDNKSI